MTINNYGGMFEKSRTRLEEKKNDEQCLVCYYSGGGINNAPTVLEMQCARMANNSVLLLSQMRGPIPFCTSVWVLEARQWSSGFRRWTASSGFSFFIMEWNWVFYLATLPRKQWHLISLISFLISVAINVTSLSSTSTIICHRFWSFTN